MPVLRMSKPSLMWRSRTRMTCWLVQGQSRRLSSICNCTAPAAGTTCKARGRASVGLTASAAWPGRAMGSCHHQPDSDPGQPGCVPADGVNPQTSPGARSCVPPHCSRRPTSSSGHHYFGGQGLSWPRADRQVQDTREIME